MAELADAPDLGSGGRPCRFESCYPQESEISKSCTLESLIFLWVCSLPFLAKWDRIGSNTGRVSELDEKEKDDEDSTERSNVFGEGASVFGGWVLKGVSISLRQRSLRSEA